MAPPHNLLQALPFETRLIVYRALLQRAWPIERIPDRPAVDKVRSARWTSNTAILGVSKQISHEALSVLYGDNLFVASLGCIWAPARVLYNMGLTEANWLRVRRLSLHLEMTQLLPFVKVTTLVPVPCVAALLEGLSHLRIVVPDDPRTVRATQDAADRAIQLGLTPVFPIHLYDILKGQHASRRLEKLSAVLDRFYGMYNKQRGFEVFTESEILAKCLNWWPPALVREPETDLTQEGASYNVDEHHPKGDLVLSEPRPFAERGPYCRGKRTWRIWPRRLEGTGQKEGGGKAEMQGVGSLFWT